MTGLVLTLLRSVANQGGTMRVSATCGAFLMVACSLRAGPAVDFEKDIRPIFATHCHECHGPKKQRSDFRLDQKKTALTGGENGIAIVPGKSADSPLILRVTATDETRMPPKG